MILATACLASTASLLPTDAEAQRRAVPRGTPTGSVAVPRQPYRPGNYYRPYYRPYYYHSYFYPGFFYPFYAGFYPGFYAGFGCGYGPYYSVLNGATAHTPTATLGRLLRRYRARRGSR